MNQQSAERHEYHEIPMPEVGEDVEEVTVAAWLKKVGETVAVGEVLVEIQTEKANMEFESPYAGTVEAIYVQEGETAPVGKPIARIAS